MTDCVISEENLRALIACGNLPAMWARDVHERLESDDYQLNQPFQRLTDMYPKHNDSHCILIFTRNGVFEWGYQGEDPVSEDIEGMSDDLLYCAVAVPVAMRQLFRIRPWRSEMRSQFVPVSEINPA